MAIIPFQSKAPALLPGSDAETAAFLPFRVSDRQYVVEMARVRSIQPAHCLERLSRRGSLLAGTVRALGRAIPVMRMAGRNSGRWILVIEAEFGGETAIAGLLVSAVEDPMRLRKSALRGTAGVQVNGRWVSRFGSLRLLPEAAKLARAA